MLPLLYDSLCDFEGLYGGYFWERKGGKGMVEYG